MLQNYLVSESPESAFCFTKACISRLAVMFRSEMALSNDVPNMIVLVLRANFLKLECE